VPVGASDATLARRVEGENGRYILHEIAMTTVVLRNPRREVRVTGGRRVKEILLELDVVPETVLVIRGDELITADQTVRDDDVLELRPVMSGGAA